LKRILYIQYTNPAGYPPLEHSSRILADDGWQVLFLGTGALGASALCFPPHPNIRVHCLDFHPPGWRQKLHYFYFCAWVLGWILRWRPSWIYASDPLVCPAAVALCTLPWHCESNWLFGNGSNRLRQCRSTGPVSFLDSGCHTGSEAPEPKCTRSPWD